MKIVFDTNQYVKNLENCDAYFHTFINRESLAAGVLRLGPGEEDMQEPHENDEVYYVIRGDGYLNVNGKDYDISDGQSYFVAKKIPHKFHGNTKDLVVLYFFGGPDS